MHLGFNEANSYETATVSAKNHIGKRLVEASPYDRNWGIGLSAGNPKICDRSQWRGKNWAGDVLASVRDTLRKETMAYHSSKESYERVHASHSK